MENSTNSGILRHRTRLSKGIPETGLPSKKIPDVAIFVQQKVGNTVLHGVEFC